MPHPIAVRNQFRHEVLVSGISNTIFNGLIAWLLLRGGSNLTLGGEHSYIIDIIATAFLLPFIVALIVIPLNQRKQRSSKLPGVDIGAGHWLARAPRGLFSRALAFGLVGATLFAPITLLLLWALGVTEFTPNSYALFKGLWAGLLAATLVGPMFLLALKKER